MQFLQNLQEYNVKNLNGKLLGLIILKKTFYFRVALLKKQNREACDKEYDSSFS